MLKSMYSETCMKPADTLGTLAGVRFIQGVLLIQVLINCETIVNDLLYLHLYLPACCRSLETDTLSWWDGLRGSMTLMGYASESLYSWQVQPCGTGHFNRIFLKRKSHD